MGATVIWPYRSYAKKKSIEVANNSRRRVTVIVRADGHQWRRTLGRYASVSLSRGVAGVYIEDITLDVHKV